MFFVKEISDDLGLFLSTMQMTANGSNHFVSIRWPALPERICFDILVQQFIGIQFWTVSGQMEHLNLVLPFSRELFYRTTPMDRMALRYLTTRSHQDRNISFMNCRPPLTAL